MKKTEIGEDLYQYIFPEDENRVYGFNIFALIHDNKALVIDTAYMEQAQMVRKDLEENGIKPEMVFISHYHPDHTGGSEVFKDCEIIGSVDYEESLNYCKSWSPDTVHLAPTRVMADGDSLDFGPFHVKVLQTPGHSSCSISLVLNDQWVHVGDLVMASNHGEGLLPVVAVNGSFEEHIRSLKRIKNLGMEKLLLAHGKTIEGKEKIAVEIDDRVSYLNKVLESKGTLTAEESLQDCTRKFLCHQWHNSNIKKFT